MRTVTRDSLRGSRDFRAVADAFLALITSNAGRISAMASIWGDTSTSSCGPSRNARLGWARPPTPRWLCVKSASRSLWRIHAEPGRRTKVSPVRL